MGNAVVNWRISVLIVGYLALTVAIFALLAGAVKMAERL